MEIMAIIGCGPLGNGRYLTLKVPEGMYPLIEKLIGNDFKSVKSAELSGPIIWICFHQYGGSLSQESLKI